MANLNTIENSTDATADVETVDVAATPGVENGVDRTNAADATETIRLVSYDRIRFDHVRNPRRAERYTAKENGWLSRNIHKNGLLDALVLSERADGTLWLLKGHLRHAAIGLIRTEGLLAGTPKAENPAIEKDPTFMQKVKCRVLRGLSLAEEMDILMDHGTTTPLDKRELYVAGRTMRRIGFSQNLAADKLGISRSAFSKMCWVMSMPSVVEDAYLADPSDKTAVSLTETAITDLYKAYNQDQKSPSAKVKVGGKEFNGAWERIVAEGPAQRRKSLTPDKALSLAEIESDGDLRDLLSAFANANEQEIGAALERLRIRLRPINDLSGFGHRVVEEGIVRTVGE